MSKEVRQPVLVVVDRAISYFNLQSEPSKINISIPFNELLRNNEYRDKITRMVKDEGDCHLDTLELTDDAPTIVLGPKVEYIDEEDVPPFYVSLNIHDMILHNAMLDFGASHNLMARVVVESLGLEITRPYKDQYSFDSRKVRCLGLIKNMVVTVAHILVKSIVIDVVVADTPHQIWYAIVKILGFKTKRNITDGHVLCNHSFVWRSQDIV